MIKVSQADIVFIHPPPLHGHVFAEHLGMAYLQAFLSQYGLRTTQVAIKQLGFTIRECADIILAKGAKIYGFSCYDSNTRQIALLSRMIKQCLPDAFIMAGGPTATFSTEYLLKICPDVDCAIRSEGEVTVAALTRHLLGGGAKYDLDTIPGLTFRRDREIVHNIDRPRWGENSSEINKLDSLPSPYLTGILIGDERAGLVTSRGCPHKCTYCNVPGLTDRTVRNHSIDRVIAELQIIQHAQEKADINGQLVVFHDDTFSLNPRRAKEICLRIIQEKIRLNLFALTRADNMDEELVSLMHNAGFIAVAFGLESAVPQILRNIKKVCSSQPRPANETYYPEKRFLDSVRKGIALAKKYKMGTLTSIILGLPGESKTEGQQTIDFVRSLNVDHYVHNFLKVCRGTELARTAANYGILVKEPRYGLPLMTHLSYPARDVSVLPNSSLFEDQKKLEHTVLWGFAGGPLWGVYQGKGVRIVMAELEGATASSDLLNWVAHSLSMGADVIAMGANRCPMPVYADKISEQWPAFPDTYSLYVLKNHFSDNSTRMYSITTNPVAGKNTKIAVLPVSDAIYVLQEEAPSQEMFPVFVIDKMEDVRIVISLAEEMLGNSEKSNRNEKQLHGVFQDGCRWGQFVCPALNARRFIASYDGRIKPCFSSPFETCSTGCVDRLKKQYSILYREIREQRGCDDCRADATCSKCLFPHPVTSKKFCEIQKSFPYLRELVTSTNIANTYSALS